jgi:hypothetical protein
MFSEVRVQSDRPASDFKVGVKGFHQALRRSRNASGIAHLLANEVRALDSAIEMPYFC